MFRSSWLLVVALAGCSGSDTPPPPTSSLHEMPHVVLIKLDTARADRIGAYGYADAETPALDALAARGRRYARAYSPIPLTIPAHAAIMSGMQPWELGIRDNGDGVLPETVLTLAEHMRAQGYLTGASVGAYVTGRKWGFSQGFAGYFDSVEAAPADFWHSERDGAAVVDDLLAWREHSGADAPIFAWVHLYDAHYPFISHEGQSEDLKQRPYDAELAYVDAQVARLVEAFPAEHTIFVVVGDHGEGLAEHLELQHGMFVYNNTQHVPMIIAGPGVESGVVEDVVELADVAPTILAMIGVDSLPEASGRAIPGGVSRPIYMEANQLQQRARLARQIAVIDGSLKLIDSPQPELYDLAVDPTEKTNLAAARPEDVLRLREVLAGLGVPELGATASMDAETRARLVALGYAQGDPLTTPAEPLPDYKDHTSLLVGLLKLERLDLEGQDGKLEPLARELIASHPDLREPRERLVRMLMRAGRQDEAMPLIEQGLLADPDGLSMLGFKATILAQRKEFNAASILFSELAERQPFSPIFRRNAVAATRDAGHLEEALALADRYLKEHADDDRLRGLVGLLLLQDGKRSMAVDYLKRGALASPPEEGVCFAMATLAASGKQPDLALRLLERELEYYPGNTQAVAALLTTLTGAKDWTKLLEVAERLLPLRPHDLPVAHAKVSALYQLQRYPEARAALGPALEEFPGDPSLLLVDANLLRKEGREDEAKVRFKEATEARAALGSRLAAPSSEGAPASAGH